MGIVSGSDWDQKGTGVRISRRTFIQLEKLKELEFK